MEDHMKKVALFGGGFDPIHYGHLNLAVQMKEKHKLDEIYFCPAYCSPHKKGSPPVASGQDRLNMVKTLIDEVDGFFSYDFEIKRESLSYTIDTLESLALPDRELYLILSDDVFYGLARWEKVDEVLEIAQPLVGKRKGDTLNIPKKWEKRFNEGLTQTSMVEISSTEIRARLKNNLYCGHLVPKQVLDYIHKKSLYS